PEGIGETIFFFLLVLLGSLLPDLDTTKSKLGRKLWPIAFLISLFVKHRTATHSLLFVGGVIISSGFAVIILKLTWFYALAIGLGTISHITGDWLTSRGVPLLYPFRKERFKAPIT
ncbi:metal-dependent hydrolase, partial [Mycobacterium tuberculosis]